MPDSLPDPRPPLDATPAPTAGEQSTSPAANGTPERAAQHSVGIDRGDLFQRNVALIVILFWAAVALGCVAFLEAHPGDAIGGLIAFVMGALAICLGGSRGAWFLIRAAERRRRNRP